MITLSQEIRFYEVLLALYPGLLGERPDFKLTNKLMSLYDRYIKEKEQKNTKLTLV